MFKMTDKNKEWWRQYLVPVMVGTLGTLLTIMSSVIVAHSNRAYSEHQTELAADLAWKKSVTDALATDKERHAVQEETNARFESEIAVINQRLNR